MPDSPGGDKVADPEFRRARASKAGRARTTPEYHLDRVRSMVVASREAQGLPPVVTDELTLGRIAAILAPAREREVAS
mgnify:CR=1 FL=1